MPIDLIPPTRTKPTRAVSDLVETHPPILAIIPSRNGEVQDLKAALQAQSTLPSMIQVIIGIQPNGKARNQGVSVVKNRISVTTNKEEILLFIDDDAFPGSSELVQIMIQTLLDDDTI
jgi:hypothetical protein